MRIGDDRAASAQQQDAHCKRFSHLTILVSRDERRGLDLGARQREAQVFALTDHEKDPLGRARNLASRSGMVQRCRFTFYNRVTNVAISGRSDATSMHRGLRVHGDASYGAKPGVSFTGRRTD
jgi:hypothetical protein